MKKVVNIILLIFLPAVIWIFVNATINRHMHYTSDGLYVSHAHPFDKIPNSDPGRSHHHSDTELLLLNFLSDPVTTVTLSFFISFIHYAFIHFLKQTKSYPIPLRKHHQILNYHAPPEQ